MSRSINSLFCSWLFTVARILWNTQRVRAGCPRALAPHLDPPSATPLSPPLSHPQPSTHGRSTQGSSQHWWLCCSLQTPLFMQEPKERSGLGEEKGAGNQIPLGGFWSPVDMCLHQQVLGTREAPALHPWVPHGFGKVALPRLPGGDVLDVKYLKTCQTPQRGRQRSHTSSRLLGQSHSRSVMGQD